MPETSKKKLGEIDLKILDARLNGFSFCQLNNKEVRNVTDQIMLKAAAICGTPTPETEFFAEIISNEIESYLKEFGFGELTLAEITLAFRLNTRYALKMPTGLEVEPVRFLGSCFNVDYLSNILTNYMVYRNSLDRRLQNYLEGY